MSLEGDDVSKENDKGPSCIRREMSIARLLKDKDVKAQNEDSVFSIIFCR